MFIPKWAIALSAVLFVLLSVVAYLEAGLTYLIFNPV